MSVSGLRSSLQVPRDRDHVLLALALFSAPALAWRENAPVLESGGEVDRTDLGGLPNEFTGKRKRYFLVSLFICT